MAKIATVKQRVMEKMRDDRVKYASAIILALWFGIGRSESILDSVVIGAGSRSE